MCEKFASDRSEWSKDNHMQQMYDVVYRNMVLAKIAVNLPEKVFMDENGKVVENMEGLLFF
jgi:hypothetical protein